MSPREAHGPDESVPIEELVTCARVLERLLRGGAGQVVGRQVTQVALRLGQEAAVMVDHVEVGPGGGPEAGRVELEQDRAGGGGQHR